MIVPAKGHEGFQCSSDGFVIGKRGKPMKGRVDRCGYREVVLSEKGSSRQVLVHRLILSSFYPIKNMENLDVNHINGDKLDNRLENLEWCTRSENIIHSYENGLQKNVTNPHGTYKVLTKSQLNIIRGLHELGFVDSKIAECIGCTRGLVSRKIRGMKLR